MAKVKRYNGSDESQVSDRDYGGSSGTGEYAPEPAKTQTFKEAFASARRAGDKTFEWNGKKYTTEMAPKKSTDTGDETARLKSRVPDSKQTRLGRDYQQDMENKYSEQRRAEGRTMYGSEKPNAIRGMFAKAAGMKKGGMTASKRADGIAQRGKTRGRLV